MANEYCPKVCELIACQIGFPAPSTENRRLRRYPSAGGSSTPAGSYSIARLNLATVFNGLGLLLPFFIAGAKPILPRFVVQRGAGKTDQSRGPR